MHDDHSGQRKCYKFDHIFDENATQKSIYEDLGLNELISKVVDVGYTLTAGLPRHCLCLWANRRGENLHDGG